MVELLQPDSKYYWPNYFQLQGLLATLMPTAYLATFWIVSCLTRLLILFVCLMQVSQWIQIYRRKVLAKIS